MSTEIDPDKNEMTSLMILASKGEVSPVLQLLATGVDVNATDNRGGTALMYAAMNKHAEIVKLLLEVGASPTQKTNKGLNAVDFAIRSKSDDVVQCISEFVGKQSGDQSEIIRKLSNHLWDSVVKWVVIAFIIGFILAHQPHASFVDTLALKILSGSIFATIFGLGRWFYLK